MTNNKIIDVRGDAQGPMLGRLRGVKARHELRQFVVATGVIQCEVEGAHMVFRGAVPTPLPDLLSTSERQLVVSKALGAALRELDPTVDLVPVRLEDSEGATVGDGYCVAVVKVIANIESSSGFRVNSYLQGEVRDLRTPTEPLPPLFRVGYTLAIGCNAEAAAVLQGFSGATLVDFPDYVEVIEMGPRAYALMSCGRTGATFTVADHEYREALERGEALLASWPEGGPVAVMKPPKSQKKLQDFMETGGAPIVSAKARAALEKFDPVDVEFLPVRLQDHAGKPVKGEHWLLHVRATQGYIDPAESDIGVREDLVWHLREIVVDEQRLTARPPLFRVPGARYPWLFIRVDVLASLSEAGLTNLRHEHPDIYKYNAEGGDLRHA